MIRAAQQLVSGKAAASSRRRSFPDLSAKVNRALYAHSYSSKSTTAENFTEDTDAKAATPSGAGSSRNGDGKPITVCALNNHPNHRLKLAKERIQNSMKSPSPSYPPAPTMTIQKPREPRKSDGSSSGATTEQRLFEARKKMLEKMASEQQVITEEKKRSSSSFRVLPEPRKNDGSSSGALTEQRLREKRQAMFDKMASESQISAKEQNRNESSMRAPASLSFRALPEPRRNDGSSSGALTEQRLREKRQAMFDKMASAPETYSKERKEKNITVRAPASLSFRALPEPRKNDGSSSGALTEQRLREKRQAMFDKLASSPQISVEERTKEEISVKISAPLSSRVLPEPRKNDGSSSGALTEQRLREKRQAMLDKMAGL